MKDSDGQSVLYKRRWAFLGGLAVLQYFAGISFGSYGQISSFYVQFFHTTPAAVDWITNARNISGIFITFPLAWLVLKDKIGLRGLVLLVGISSTAGLLLVTLSFLNGAFFVLIVIGQILCGLVEILGVVIPATFAALWFPENQVGTAISINIFSLYVGNGVGYLVPPYLMFSSKKMWNQTTNFSEQVMDSGQHSLQIMYGSFLGISALTTIFFGIFFTSKPPTPPTYAQKLKVTEAATQKQPRDFWKETKLLFTNYSYVLISLAIGFTFQVILLENILMSEIVHSVGDYLKGIKPLMISGYIMSMCGLGSFAGVLASGKVVDVCKKYKILAMCSTIALFFSSVGVTLCVLFNQVIPMFVCNAMFGFFSGSTVVILLEKVTQLTYPIDESLANIWMTGIQTTVGMIEAFIGRLMFDAFGSVGVLSFQCACVLLGFSLICLVSSRNRRLEVGDAANCRDEDAHAPLLGQ